jgi:FixJ family two-component response regulator
MIPDDARVYVIDDDASFVRSVVRLLTSYAIGAEGFTSASEFLDRAPDEGPACALIDLSMPGVNGFEVQEALLRARRELPVVFISGHTDAQSGVDAMRSGAVAFLTKPVDEQRLLAALELAFEAEVERTDRASPDEARAGLIQLVERERVERSGSVESVETGATV